MVVCCKVYARRQDNETFSVANGTSPTNNGTNTTNLRTSPKYFLPCMFFRVLQSTRVEADDEQDLDSLCHEYIDAIQTHPRSALDPATRTEILNLLGNCTMKKFGFCKLHTYRRDASNTHLASTRNSPAVKASSHPSAPTFLWSPTPRTNSILPSSQ